MRVSLGARRADEPPPRRRGFGWRGVLASFLLVTALLAVTGDVTFSLMAMIFAIVGLAILRGMW